MALLLAIGIQRQLLQGYIAFSITQLRKAPTHLENQFGMEFENVKKNMVFHVIYLVYSFYTI